uniref:Prostate transmembrane protein, androgen induced 1 n=1 Tax=Equus caballus TaxID=9796 RepID=A0A9L0T678_HORSE
TSQETYVGRGVRWCSALQHFITPLQCCSRHCSGRCGTSGDKDKPCPLRAAPLEGCLWPSESTVSGSGIPEPQVYAPPRPADRLAVPPFAQRARFHRFQPTYPYLQHEIDLPPTISLSDGEEPPPYQGPCTLQLRDAEQQLELNRESVRAPPNRTIFDSDLMDSAMLGGPCPPSSNSGISATCYGGGGRMEGPPPTYSEVIGHYPGSSSFQHQQSSGPHSLLEGTRLHHAHIAPLESTAAWSKEKDKQKGHPL